MYDIDISAYTDLFSVFEAYLIRLSSAINMLIIHVRSYIYSVRGNNISNSAIQPTFLLKRKNMQMIISAIPQHKKRTFCFGFLLSNTFCDWKRKVTLIILYANKDNWINRKKKQKKETRRVNTRLYKESNVYWKYS